jgi:excisionase family DNA binding protein
VKGLITADQAAELLAVPKSWVLAEARAKRIPHVRLGRYVRFEAELLEEWWASRRRGPRRSKGQAARVAGHSADAPACGDGS